MSLLITKSGGLFVALFPPQSKGSESRLDRLIVTSPARNLEETGFLPEMRKTSRYSPTAQGKRCQNRRDDLTEIIHRTRENHHTLRTEEQASK
jgi:hypothetical protein